MLGGVFEGSNQPRFFREGYFVYGAKGARSFENGCTELVR